MCIGYKLDLYTSFDAGSTLLVPRVLKQYEDEFFRVVHANQSTLTLIRKGVINEDIQRAIEKANSKDAKEILYSHLMNHGSVETVKAYCKVLIEADGYPYMQTLGRKMKAALEPEGIGTYVRFI